MKKETLTKAMKEALSQIIDYIDLAKKYDNYHDYYMAKNLRYITDRKNFDEFIVKYKERYLEIVDSYEKRYERISKAKYFEIVNLRPWKNARENDIALTIGVSSSTLRALEVRGYIKILKDGRSRVDEVKLLKRYEN